MNSGSEETAPEHRTVFGTDEADSTDHVILNGSGPDGETVQMAGTGRNAGATSSAGGAVDYWIAGRHAGKEPVELKAAASLVDKLNQLGGRWASPTVITADARSERGVDCEAQPADGSGASLQIQVTTPQCEAWTVLARQPEPFEKSTTIDVMVESLRRAIEAKRLKSDPEILLVLAAYDSPAHALRSVADAFVDQLGDWAGAVGFCEVWLAGPTVELVHRLDRRSVT